MAATPAQSQLSSDLPSIIRAELARRQIRQLALADALGISQGQVSARLAGRVRITVDELRTIAGVIGIPAEQLLGQVSA